MFRMSLSISFSGNASSKCNTWNPPPPPFACTIKIIIVYAYMCWLKWQSKRPFSQLTQRNGLFLYAALLPPNSKKPALCPSSQKSAHSQLRQTASKHRIGLRRRDTVPTDCAQAQEAAPESPPRENPTESQAPAPPPPAARRPQRPSSSARRTRGPARKPLVPPHLLFAHKAGVVVVGKSLRNERNGPATTPK